MKTRKSITALLLVIFTVTTYAQPNADDELQRENRFFDRVVVGGGLGLQFGTVTFIEISPLIGYRLTEKLETGIGLTYKYYRYKDFYYDQTTNDRFDLKSNIYGASVYTRYHILQSVFLHAEYERLRYNYDDVYVSAGQLIKDPTHANVDGLFLGGGYRQRISANSYFYISALWDIIQDPYSPYNNPILRMGVLLGR